MHLKAIGNDPASAISTPNRHSSRGPGAARGRLTAVFLLLLFWVTGGFAEKIGWHDRMSLHFGDGVDLKNQTEAKAPRVAVVGTEPIWTPSSGDVSETIRFAQHTFDLVSSLSVNASISLQSYMFSGNAGVSFISNRRFSANALNFVFTATRNFGDTKYPVLGFSPDFNAVVGELRKTYRGPALHEAITQIFGTHVVRGYQSAAMVSVIFSLNYGSASLSQQLSASASGSWSYGDFSSQVDAFFRSKDTRRTLTYEFYSSDPYQSPTNFTFNASGSITNFEEFSKFVTLVEAYWRAMNPANAKVTGYILDPIQNVPGYLPMLEGYSPGSTLPTDYSSFLEVYARLQSWNQRLTEWTLNPKRMSWLNNTGQRLALEKRQDVADYVTAMESLATNHFLTGAPLQVPTEIFNYLYTFSDIPIPALYVAWANDDSIYTAGHGLIGWVDCGSKSNTLATPFAAVSEVLNGRDVGWTTPLCYEWADVTNLVKNQLAFWRARSGATETDLRQFFASSYWASLTNTAFTCRRIGFFADARLKAEKTNTFMVISDAEGNTVDQLNWLSTRSGSIPECSPQGVVAISVLSAASLVQGSVGLAGTIPMVVTNSGPAPAHKVNLSFQLAPGFEFAGLSGSQGYSHYDPATRLVSYAVGPIPPGGQAAVGLRVIPLASGPLVPGSNASVTVGEIYTNVASGPINLPALNSESPVLAFRKAANALELAWASDTDRLLVAHSPRLGPGESWSIVTNSPLSTGSKRVLTVPSSAPHMFYRLETR